MKEGQVEAVDQADGRNLDRLPVSRDGRGVQALEILQKLLAGHARP